MTAKPTYNKHLASLAAIFILGDAVIVLPTSNSGDYPLLGFFIGTLAAVLLYFVSLAVTNLFIGKSILLILAGVYAFYNAGKVFIRYTDFADKILLPKTPEFLIAAVFIIAAVYLATRRQDVILKLSLISAVIAVMAILLFFMLSFKDFKAENIAVQSFPDFGGIIKSTKPFFLNISLPALLIPVYSRLFTEEKRICAPFAGLLSGLTLEAVCLLESLLLFGAPLAERIEFPLAAAVSTVTVGQLFTRMDGIVYCLFFVLSLIKTAVCIKLAFVALSRGGHRDPPLRS